MAVIHHSGGAEGAPSLLQHFSAIPHNPHKKCVSKQVPSLPPKQIATFQFLFYGNSGAITD